MKKVAQETLTALKEVMVTHHDGSAIILSTFALYLQSGLVG